jgi:CheY-like chemotaxis protein
MIFNRCHACHGVSTADADRCEACGTALKAVVPQFDKRASSGAIWLDDLTRPQAQAGPAPAADTVPGLLPELAITLLEVEAGAPVSAQWSVASALPMVEGLVLSDYAAAVTEVTSQAAELTKVRPNRKAERRAAVRKSRLRGKPAPGGESTAPEVLVFDPHDGERDRLRNLLHDFGFRVHAVGRADEAVALVKSHTFIAAFVEMVPDAADGGAGLDLCQRVRAAGRCRDGTDTLLVLTATRLKPMDRVRAELAGCEEIILKPVIRSSVAGVLDSRGIAFPIDRRQS